MRCCLVFTSCDAVFNDWLEHNNGQVESWASLKVNRKRQLTMNAVKILLGNYLLADRIGKCKGCERCYVHICLQRKRSGTSNQPDCQCTRGHRCNCRKTHAARLPHCRREWPRSSRDLQATSSPATQIAGTELRSPLIFEYPNLYTLKFLYMKRFSREYHSSLIKSQLVGGCERLLEINFTSAILLPFDKTANTEWTN